MPRQTDLAKRALLVEQTAEYLGVHGLADTSLREVAAALGTTSRMLVYYFGTKEALFSATLDFDRERFRDAFADAGDVGELQAALTGLLREMSAGSKESAARLLIQMLGSGTSKSSEYHAHARRAIDDMRRALQDALMRLGVSERPASQHATIIGAAFRGLLIDRLTTTRGDDVDAAGVAMLEMLVDVATHGSKR